MTQYFISQYTNKIWNSFEKENCIWFKNIKYIPAGKKIRDKKKFKKVIKTCLINTL